MSNNKVTIYIQPSHVSVHDILVEVANLHDELYATPYVEEKTDVRVRDKRSKLEALKNFNRVHPEDTLSSAKRRNLRNKRKNRGNKK